MRHEGLGDAEWVDACADTLRLLGEVETLAPGPELAARCAEIAGMPLCVAGQVRLAALWVKIETWSSVQRMRSQLAAVDQESDVGRDAARPGLLTRSVIAELAVTTCVSELTINRQVSDAVEITAWLPVMTATLEAGRLTTGHGKALAGALTGASDELHQRIDAELTPRAVDRGWTPYELRQAATRMLLRLDPDGCADRAAQVKKLESNVTYRTLCDGLAQLTATGDNILLRQVLDAIDAVSNELVAVTAGDHPAPEFADHRIGERRIEALARLVLGDAGVDRPDVQVLVTMTATALLGLCDTPAIVSGVGPIPAHLARTLAADGTWRRLTTDPHTGQVLDLGQSSYQPSAALRRIVLAEHGTCRFPGGGTDRCNLGPLCRHHHNLKTFGLWSVIRHPDGTETWTSPHGFQRVTHPIDYREFATDDVRARDPDPPPHDWETLTPLLTPDQDFDPWAPDSTWTMLDNLDNAA